MKKIICTLLCGTIIFSLIGCSNTEKKPVLDTPEVEITTEEKTNTEDALKFKQSYEELNSKEGAVQVSIPEDNPIVYLKEEEVMPFLNKETGIIYFGFASCPWCRNAAPELIQVAKENNMQIFYFDVLALRNSENETETLIKEKLDKYLLTDNNGVKKLYVPDVYFVKNGEIVYNHLDTVTSQKDAKIPLTEEQKQELRDIYQEGVNAILDETNE